jgi:prepilin-type N-terminal cleavage/methylation domain-containing protein
VSKGFTLIEMVLTVIILSVLGAFTFSVIKQYSNLYADTKGGYVYGEAAAVLERITRELRDAGDVYTEDVPTAPFVSSTVPPYTASYINFSLTHGTPATGGTFIPPQWVQYCICWNASSHNSRALLYRVQNIARTDGDYCQASCPTGNPNAVLMSGNIMSSHSDRVTVPKQGFRVKYLAGDGSTVDDDCFEITLALAADRLQNNLLDVPPDRNNVSITLVTRVSPRNYNPTVAGRSFKGNYYDQID